MSITIETYTFSNGQLKEKVLEFISQSDGSVSVHYVSADYPNGYTKGKQNDAVLTTENPAVHIDYKGRLMFYGDVDLILDGAMAVSGKTFDIKELIKKHGFVWDGGNQKWVTPAALEATNVDLNFTPTKIPDDAFRFIEGYYKKNEISEINVSDQIIKAFEWIAEYFDLDEDDNEAIFYWNGKSIEIHKGLETFELQNKEGFYIISNEGKIGLLNFNGWGATEITRK